MSTIQIIDFPRYEQRPILSDLMFRTPGGFINNSPNPANEAQDSRGGKYVDTGYAIELGENTVPWKS